MQLRIVSCGIICTIVQYIILFDGDFCDCCGDFVGDFSDFVDFG